MIQSMSKEDPWYQFLASIFIHTERKQMDRQREKDRQRDRDNEKTETKRQAKIDRPENKRRKGRRTHGRH